LKQGRVPSSETNVGPWRGIVSGVETVLPPIYTPPAPKAVEKIEAKAAPVNDTKKVEKAVEPKKADVAAAPKKEEKPAAALIQINEEPAAKATEKKEVKKEAATAEPKTDAKESDKKEVKKEASTAAAAPVKAPLATGPARANNVAKHGFGDDLKQGRVPSFETNVGPWVGKKNGVTSILPVVYTPPKAEAKAATPVAETKKVEAVAPKKADAPAEAKKEATAEPKKAEAVAPKKEVAKTEKKPVTLAQIKEEPAAEAAPAEAAAEPKKTDAAAEPKKAEVAAEPKKADNATEPKKADATAEPKADAAASTEKKTAAPVKSAKQGPLDTAEVREDNVAKFGFGDNLDKGRVPSFETNVGPWIGKKNGVTSVLPVVYTPPAPKAKVSAPVEKKTEEPKTDASKTDATAVPKADAAAEPKKEAAAEPKKEAAAEPKAEAPATEKKEAKKEAVPAEPKAEAKATEKTEAKKEATPAAAPAKEAPASSSLL
jgi:hypothetical protein